jgi:hypothetical protein
MLRMVRRRRLTCLAVQINGGLSTPSRYLCGYVRFKLGPLYESQ